MLQIKVFIKGGIVLIYQTDTVEKAIKLYPKTLRFFQKKGIKVKG